MLLPAGSDIAEPHRHIQIHPLFPLQRLKFMSFTGILNVFSSCFIFVPGKVRFLRYTDFQDINPIRVTVYPEKVCRSILNRSFICMIRKFRDIINLDQVLICIL